MRTLLERTLVVVAVVSLMAGPPAATVLGLLAQNAAWANGGEADAPAGDTYVCTQADGSGECG